MAASQAPGLTARTNVAREIVYTWLGMAFTLVFLVIGIFNPVRDFIAGKTIGVWPAFLDAVEIFIITFYVWGQLIYEWCRLGYLKCFAGHEPPGRTVLEAVYDRDDAAALIVLVPAYCEPPDIVRMTLMSAALLEHPNHSVVLLIDNPPDPADSAAAMELEATRRTVVEIEYALRTQEQGYAAELAAYCRRRRPGSFDAQAEADRLAMLYLEAARWLEEQAASFSDADHIEALFTERILREPARKHRARAIEIASRALSNAFSEAEALHEYRRLAGLFAARVSSFERKRYVNLSHFKNKASNLNSFLGLLGRSVREELRSDGLHLLECDDAAAQLRVPDVSYVIICDADSILLDEYALKLIHVMEQPGGERIAVAQVCSLAIPDSPVLMQRVAGAQTDVHRVMGHGSSRHGAAFWAGNNALMRRAALTEIEELASERGFPIKRYIRDRTLIEDTETTIEFISHGWEIYSFPDTLAYSGTPSDYGGLLIQRRRWAGGGLLNVPKLVRYLYRAPDLAKRIPEALLRLHYLGVAAMNFGWFLLPILAIIRVPPPGWWIAVCVPFYLLYWRDLLDIGYSHADVLRVQALNMLLIAVNVEGSITALHRYLVGHRRTFPRTPKSSARTPMPASYAVVALLMPVGTAIVTMLNIVHGRWTFAALGVFNATLLSYALARLVGPVAALRDIQSAIGARMRRASSQELSTVTASQPPNSAALLPKSLLERPTMINEL